MTDSWSPERVHIGLMTLEDFTCSPSHIFKRLANGKLRFSLNDVNVFSDWVDLFETKPYPLEYVTETKKDLIDIKRQLLTLPTFLSYELINRGVFPPKTEKYVILINPRQNDIKKKLGEALNRCVDLFDDDVFFAMEFRVDNAVAEFCRKHNTEKKLRVPYSANSICVTNCEKRCQIWYQNPWCWTCFLPAGLLIGLPYCLCRRCHVVDHACSLVGNVTHVEHHHDHHGHHDHHRHDDHHGHHDHHKTL